MSKATQNSLLSALELLHEMEFVPIYNGGESPLTCIVCGASARSDDDPPPEHTPGCRLSALLQEEGSKETIQ
jgi:hypothetical protein